jgi:hypothetical protein
VTGSRAVAVWGLLVAHAAAEGRRASVADVCAVAVSSARMDGAWLAAARDGEPDFVMCVTGPVGERLAEVQLTLGEGPGRDALTSAAPVLASDMGDAEFSRRWPAFTPAARQLGACAAFAFPLIVGAIRVGVLGLYRVSAGPVLDEQLGDLLILADVATVMLLGGTDGDGDGAWVDGQGADLALHRAEIDQATGMLTVQLGVPAAEAFVRLRAYAYAQDRRLTEVAGDIVARRLRLSQDQGQDGGP